MNIFAAYGEALPGTLLPMLGVFVGCAGIGYALTRCPPRQQRALATLLFITILTIGLTRVVMRAALFDDAYISFRYADNLARGEGLVWNVGERVEGYTNFLWTVAIAGLSLITPFEIPFVGLALSVLSYVAVVGLTYVIGRKLEGRSVHVPIATLLVAVSTVVASYGTSGLETAAAAAAVLFGMLFSIGEPTPRRASLAGLSVVLGALLRPDHVLFFGCGALTLVPWIVAVWRANERRKALLVVLAYSSPLVLLALHMVFRVSYYGDWAPNTYYAKSANVSWWSQGAIYTALFALASHAWLLVLFGLPFLLRGPRDGASVRARIFISTGVVAYTVYVMKVGGDFMAGRFFVSCIPLLALAAERSLHIARRPIIVGGLSGLMAITAVDVPLIGHQALVEGVTDESTFYPLEGIFPIRVHHPGVTQGQAMHDLFTDRGLHPIVSTGGIGMIGYYSRLEVIDIRGLTDRTVARMPLTRRGRPGHEKKASPDYLLARGVHLIRARDGIHPSAYRDLTRIQAPRLGVWEIAQWDPDLMDEIARRAPEVRFRDFPRYLDSYLRRVGSFPTERVARDLAWFDRYYFDHVPDARRERIVEALNRPRDTARAQSPDPRSTAAVRAD